MWKVAVMRLIKKSALFVFIGIALGTLNVTDLARGEVPQTSCPTRRPPIADINIDFINGLNKEIRSKSIDISPKNPDIGYRFKANAGEQLTTFLRPPGTCAWLYLDNTNKALDWNEPFTKDGQYTLQISALDKMVSGVIKLSLDNPNRQEVIVKPAQTAKLPSLSSPAIIPPTTGFQIDWVKDIALNSFVNIACTLLLIFLGNFGLRSIKDYLKILVEKKESRDLKIFWFGESSSESDDVVDLCKYHIVFGLKPSSKPGGDASISPEYISAIRHIRQFLEGSGCEVIECPLMPDERLSNAIFEGNVILLTGDEYSLLGFEKFVEDVKLPYFFKRNNNSLKLFRRLRSFSGDQLEYRQASIMDKDNPNTISLAFGTLTRLVNPDSNRIIIVLNGEYGFGVSASADFLTKYEHGQASSLSYLDFGKLNRDVGSYQIVLEASNGTKTNNLDRKKDLHLSTWIRVGVEQDELKNAIADLCQGKAALPQPIKEVQPVGNHP
jgi:hypothetical protein